MKISGTKQELVERLETAPEGEAPLESYKMDELKELCKCVENWFGRILSIHALSIKVFSSPAQAFLSSLTVALSRWLFLLPEHAGPERHASVTRKNLVLHT